ncbi:rod-binding protein [Rouxiella sp. WC2420]|uniref:Rod-binding protein n=2 Tax=Yersiniaceae TaxID=1903411 RepID=A0AB39VRK3_9GAMM
MVAAISTSRAYIPGDFGGSAKPQNIAQASEQFEAMFLRSMTQQMRKASDALVGDDDPFNSKQQRMMRDFYDDKLSQTLAAQHRSGIADLLIKQLGQREKP